MATFRTIKVNGKDYNFFCTARSNRSGFVHECELQNADGYVLATSKAQYYNRTWESYRFESVMGACVYELIKERTADLVDNFKADKGYKNLTEKRRDELEPILKADADLMELAELRDNVRNGYKLYNFI